MDVVCKGEFLAEASTLTQQRLLSRYPAISPALMAAVVEGVVESAEACYALLVDDDDDGIPVEDAKAFIDGALSTLDRRWVGVVVAVHGFGSWVATGFRRLSA